MLVLVNSLLVAYAYFSGLGMLAVCDTCVTVLCVWEGVYVDLYV
jgi:hypothetical protein